MYEFIREPNSGIQLSINSTEAKNLLKNYIMDFMNYRNEMRGGSGQHVNNVYFNKDQKYQDITQKYEGERPVELNDDEKRNYKKLTYQPIYDKNEFMINTNNNFYIVKNFYYSENMSGNTTINDITYPISTKSSSSLLSSSLL